MNEGVVRATTLVRGGVGKLADALASAAKARARKFARAQRSVQIRAHDQRVSGVVLASGEEISAKQIISSADPKRTFLQMLDPLELDPTFYARVRHIRMRGGVAKMNLALDGMPDFKGATPEQLRGTISISPSETYLERAYDDAKYGSISQQPYLEIVIPSLTDSTRAPQGKHVMSVWMQYAPYQIKTGDWKLETNNLTNIIFDTLSHYAPNLQSLVLQSQLLTPLRFGRHVWSDRRRHQSRTDDARPIFVYASRCRAMPNIARCWMDCSCAARAHIPVASLAAAGRNAAREILK